MFWLTFIFQRSLSLNQRLPRFVWWCLTAASITAAPSQALTTEPVTQPHIRVSLVSQMDSLQPGVPAKVGLLLQPDEHWHVYWRNPGDSGMAPKLAWDLPQGITAGPIEWPFPEQIPVQHLMNFGYHSEVLLPVTLNISPTIEANHITLPVKANWLVCQESCIPGEARLKLSIPVANSSAKVDTKRAALFEQASARQPEPLTLLGATVTRKGAAIAMDLFSTRPLFRQAERITFFPITENLVEYGEPAQLRWAGNLVQIKQARSLTFTKMPEVIEGLLVVDEQKAWHVKFNP